MARIQARQTDTFTAVMVPSDGPHAADFIRDCTVGSHWQVHVRTASLRAEVIRCEPLLGDPDVTQCLRVTFRLTAPLAVEPRLRVFVDKYSFIDQPPYDAEGVVTPWERSAQGPP